MEPKILEIPIHKDPKGKLAVLDKQTFLPFDIKRVFYIYDLPKGTKRGGHGHKDLEQFIWCIHGKVELFTLSRKGIKSSFILDTPNKGLYIPPLTWSHQIALLDDSIYCVAASDYYEEKEYIRNFDDFLNIVSN